MSPLAQRLPCLLCSSFFLALCRLIFLNLLRNSCQFRAIPAGDLQHFRRPRTVVFSSCRGQMGERRGWKSRGPKTLSRQNCTSPTLVFSVSGSREKEGVRASIAENRIDRSIATMSLWVDKHRPRCLDQLRVHSKPARQLQKLLAGGDCPHLLFYGPSGAGKKTLCLATLREVGDLCLHPPLRPPPTRFLTLDSFLFRSSSGRRWRSFARSRRLGRSRWVPLPASAPPALDAI